MNFTFTDDQRLMAEAARDILLDVCTPEHWRAQRAALGENGLFGVLRR